jgi:hypothetical protein
MSVSAQPCSANARSPDLDHRPGAEARKHRAQVRFGQRHAALGRQIAGPGDVQKNGAAFARLGWIVIVSQFDDQIVKAVIAPKPLMAPPAGQGDEAVIVRLIGIIAPAIRGPQRNRRQVRLWSRAPVRPEKHPPYRPASEG